MSFITMQKWFLLAVMFLLDVIAMKRVQIVQELASEVVRWKKVNMRDNINT